MLSSWRNLKKRRLISGSSKCCSFPLKQEPDFQNYLGQNEKRKGAQKKYLKRFPSISIKETNENIDKSKHDHRSPNPLMALVPVLPDLGGPGWPHDKLAYL